MTIWSVPFVSHRVAHPLKSPGHDPGIYYDV